MVAQPWRRAGKLGIPFGLCVAPLRLGGIRGKPNTPSDWLGGTGVVSMVGEWERRGAGAGWSVGSSFEVGVKEMVCFSFA